MNICPPQLPIVTPPLSAVPDLGRYDAIVIAVSGGKDSQTALRHTVREAERQGVALDRVFAVHADLGRVEWPGVVDLVRTPFVPGKDDLDETR